MITHQSQTTLNINWKTGKIGQKTLTMAVLISYRWFCGSGGCFKLGKGGVVLVVGGGLLPEVGQGCQ